MIQTSLTTLVFVYLFAFLTLVFGVWLWQEWRKQRRERAILRHRIRCAICALNFADTTTDLLPRCPRCGALNERYRLATL